MMVGGIGGNVESIKMCKYAKAISYKEPIECLKHVPPGGHCPKDSGTDGKCNHECYSYKIIQR